MPEEVTRSAAGGELRAVFRLHAPAGGGHYYATLREHESGASRFTLELRRGLVWGFSEASLVMAAEALVVGEDDHAVVVHQSGRRSVSDLRVPGGDLAVFAREALRLAADRLGVELGSFTAATHLDLGETGTLQVQATVREKSAALLEQALAWRPATAAAPARRAPTPTAAAAQVGVAATAPAPHPTASTVPPASARPADPSPASVSTAELPTAGESRSGLLGRFVVWLRRAARAALGR